MLISASSDIYSVPFDFRQNNALQKGQTELICDIIYTYNVIASVVSIAFTANFSLRGRSNYYEEGPGSG